MNVLIFGSSGMVGQGVLREALLAADVERVVIVVRRATNVSHGKLQEIVVNDFLQLDALAPVLPSIDACFFCLGVSSSGMTEQEYTRITYDYALAAGNACVQANPAMAFVFVSGANTDSTEQGKTMWARVKGKTENALLALPFKSVCAFRPAAIRSSHGERSRTLAYRVLYIVLWPFLPLLVRLFPKWFTSTQEIAVAMLKVARNGAPKPILENHDINAFAASSPSPAT